MITIIAGVLVSFFVTWFLTPFLINYFKNVGIVGIDQHKKDKPILPSSGGISVAIGILCGLLTFVGLETFLFGISGDILSLLAITSSILIVTLVGLFDDLNVASKRVIVKDMKEIRIGLPQWAKPLLTLPAAIPLMVISAGNSHINLPLIGLIDVGILYPLVLIPIGIVGASNAVNMLGGFNGVEAGMGIFYMLGLGMFALLTHNDIAVLFFIATAALLAFIRFNWYPARILPGDSMTYLLGSVLAAGVIVGNMERFGIILMLPFLVEFVLKLRSGFKATSLGKLRKDGAIENIYGSKIYSLTHIVMNIGRFGERSITVILVSLEILLVLIVLGVYLL
ncbi:MAG: hypothetical protein HYT70_00840 [Candidatus Aenigmarchaeota archaeon]|nr:hypothetical protein [Candidatus Aenigmarchaeota archaeon]